MRPPVRILNGLVEAVEALVAVVGFSPLCGPHALHSAVFCQGGDLERPPPWEPCTEVRSRAGEGGRRAWRGQPEVTSSP